MKIKSLVFGILLLLIVGHDVYGQEKDPNLVRKAFDNYKAAILNDQGEEAVKYVDSRTINYYAEILELVRTADSATVVKQSILNKLMVFSIRHRTSREDILRFDGRTLLVYAIQSGMVGKNSVANITIGEVIIENNFARGQFVSKGQKAPFYFQFNWEDGQWKVDLTAIFPISGKAFQTMADQSELGEDQYIFSLLELLSGRKPGPEIWQPVK